MYKPQSKLEEFFLGEGYKPYTPVFKDFLDYVRNGAMLIPAHTQICTDSPWIIFVNESERMFKVGLNERRHPICLIYPRPMCRCEECFFDGMCVTETRREHYSDSKMLEIESRYHPSQILDAIENNLVIDLVANCIREFDDRDRWMEKRYDESLDTIKGRDIVFCHPAS